LTRKKKMSRTNPLKFSLSPLAEKSLKPSFINRMTSDFALDFREGMDINIGVGYVNDQTIPVEEIATCYAQVTQHPHIYRNALNYGGAEGSPNLREAISNYYKRHAIGNLSKAEVDQHEVVIGVNGATSLLDGFSDIMAPGIVITGDPFYYSYTENLSKKGFEVLSIESDDEGIIPEKIEEALAQIDQHKLAYFYIITVNNPDSIILNNERRRRIVEIANKVSDNTGHLIPVIFDKAYEDIIHNPEVKKPDSGLKYNERGNVFEIGTLSKLVAPALRIGYMLSKENPVRQQIIQRISDIGFSNSLINQEISSYFIDHYLDVHKDKVNAAYREKARSIKQMLKYELHDYTQSIQGGDAGFYFYITFKHIETHEDSPFFKFLSRTTGDPNIDGVPNKNPRLIYIPGTVCSRQAKAKRQLRLSYGFEAPETYKSVAKLIREACEYSAKQ